MPHIICMRLSNSVVGLLLLAGGIFGVIAQWPGVGAVLALFALMAALTIIAASGLEEVQMIDANNDSHMIHP